MSLSWVEDALRYLMIGIASLGVGRAHARGDMVGTALLLGAPPPRVAGSVALLGRFLIAALMLTVAWYGWQFALGKWAATATALPLSMVWVHLSVPFGSALVALHALAAAGAAEGAP